MKKSDKVCSSQIDKFVQSTPSTTPSTTDDDKDIGMLSLSRNMRMESNDFCRNLREQQHDASRTKTKGAEIAFKKQAKSYLQPSHLSQDISPGPTGATSECPKEQPIVETSATGQIRVPSGSGFRMMTPFPWRLHEMLEETEKAGQTDIVSWLPGGRSFQVHSPNRFAETIIPKYFRHKRYKSFQRQLYLYGFTSVEDQIARGAYSHPNFVREDRQLCRLITRIKPKSTTNSNKGKTNDDGGMISSAQLSMPNPNANAVIPETPNGMIPNGMFLPLCMKQQRMANQGMLQDAWKGATAQVGGVAVPEMEHHGNSFSGVMDHHTLSLSDNNVPTSALLHTVHSLFNENGEGSQCGGGTTSSSPTVGDMSETIQWLVRDAKVSLADLNNVLTMPVATIDTTNNDYQSSGIAPSQTKFQQQFVATGGVDQLKEYSDVIISLFGMGNRQ